MQQNHNYWKFTGLAETITKPEESAGTNEFNIIKERGKKITFQKQ